MLDAEWQSDARFPDDHPLIEQLRRRLPQLALHTGDACARYAIDGQAPALVALPDSLASLTATLELAAATGCSVAPWGAGTQMALGYPLAHIDMVLSLERLSRVLTYDADAQTIAVQGGCTVATLNAALRERHLFVALDGPLPAHATIGGRLATGGTGLRRSAYGNVRDLVSGLTVVLSDGQVLRTGNGAVRYETGYDLKKLFVGSLGTLGIIAEARLRVSPIPESEGSVVMAFTDPALIWSLLLDLQTAEIHPKALTVCGPGALAADRGMAPAIADMLQPASHPLLLVRLGGAPEIVQRHALLVRQLGMKYGAQEMLILRDEPMGRLWETLDNLPSTLDLLPQEAVLKVTALPSEVGKVIEMARGFSTEHGLRICWMVDANAGLAWLRVIDDTPNEPEAFGKALCSLQESLTWRWRNAIVLGCAPGFKHQLPLWGADPQGLELMRAIKSQFDSSGILNPGRFVGRI